MLVRLRPVAVVAALAVALGFVAGAAASKPEPDDVAQAAPPGVAVRAIKIAETGRLRKELGEPAGLVARGGRAAAFEIVVEDVTVVTTCPGRGASVTPSHGYFVVVDVAAAMASDVGAASRSLMPLIAEAFEVVGPEGSPQAEPTDASWSCFEDAELAPPFVGPGESVNGKVVLDSAVDHGVLVYAPGGSAGWEWGFGR